jgi:hypothetical protein
MKPKGKPFNKTSGTQPEDESHSTVIMNWQGQIQWDALNEILYISHLVLVIKLFEVH